MSEERLGKASLDLTANVDPLAANLNVARRDLGKTEDSFDALAAVAKIAEDALHRVKMDPGQGAKTRVSAEEIISGVRGISDEAREAAHELDKVRITEAQAAESDAAGDVIDRKLKDIDRQAGETRRSLDRVRLAGGRNGVGLGPFGSGFGRVGVLGTAVGLGALTGPALVPGAAGLLAGVGPLAAGGAGALGTLALAFDGVGKAIGGDYKAFKDLNPAAQRFVQTVRSLDSWLDKLKQHAAQGVFPGLTEGLHAALSPGTVAAITRAVGEFASAIGKAGAAWGRYFGSTEFQSIFGPLMASGARNLGKLSDAALRLFDAFGVLSRAAVPLVNWLADLADRGARFVDSWLHAKDASGALARSMTEARKSLQLAGKFIGAVVKVVIALGAALYPVAKVALKALTKALDDVAGWINRNRTLIRLFIGGALKDLTAVIEGATTAIGYLYNGLKTVFGSHTPILAGIAAIGIAIGVALGPEAVAITGAILAVGEILRHWTAVKTWFVEFGKFLETIFEGDWNVIKGIFEVGVANVLKPLGWLAEGVSKAFGWVPGIGGKIKDAQKAVSEFIDGLNRKGFKDLAKANADWANGAGIAATLGNGLANAFKAATSKPAKAPAGTTPPTVDLTGGSGGGNGSPFGTPPPFTTNLPKKKTPPLIPLLAQHDLSLASTAGSKASTLGNTGKMAKRYLETQLKDLQAAAALIRKKYEASSGKVKEQLFAALTRVQNQERTVRKRIAKAIKDDRAAQLQFAVDQAKSAVAAATVGTAAYRKAVTQEERALRAQIDYLKRIVVNRKLSIKVRDQAAKQEAADEKSLKALMKPINANTAANEAQFLSEFAGAVQAYAPNAVPNPQGAGQASTRLYELVNETRKQTKHLQTLGKQLRFPASGYSLASATGAYG